MQYRCAKFIATRYLQSTGKRNVRVIAMIRVIIFFVLMLSKLCFAEEIVASLDLKFVKDTGTRAGILCYGEGENDCHNWSTFYLYEAKVKKVLSGELVESHFTVIYGRHALRKNNHRNIVVRLKKLAEGAEAQYQILEFSQKVELVCFGSAESKLFDLKLESGSEELQCLEKEEL
jgi:hypothetical protein